MSQGPPGLVPTCYTCAGYLISLCTLGVCYRYFLRPSVCRSVTRGTVNAEYIIKLFLLSGLGGTTGSALDSRSEGRGFDSH